MQASTQVMYTIFFAVFLLLKNIVAFASDERLNHNSKKSVTIAEKDNFYFYFGKDDVLSTDAGEQNSKKEPGKSILKRRDSQSSQPQTTDTPLKMVIELSVGAFLIPVTLGAPSDIYSLCVPNGENDPQGKFSADLRRESQHETKDLNVINDKIKEILEDSDEEIKRAEERLAHLVMDKTQQEIILATPSRKDEYTLARAEMASLEEIIKQAEQELEQLKRESPRNGIRTKELVDTLRLRKIVITLVNLYNLEIRLYRRENNMIVPISFRPRPKYPLGLIHILVTRTETGDEQFSLINIPAEFDEDLTTEISEEEDDEESVDQPAKRQKTEETPEGNLSLLNPEHPDNGRLFALDDHQDEPKDLVKLLSTAVKNMQYMVYDLSRQKSLPTNTIEESLNELILKKLKVFLLLVSELYHVRIHFFMFDPEQQRFLPYNHGQLPAVIEYEQDQFPMTDIYLLPADGGYFRLLPVETVIFEAIEPELNTTDFGRFDDHLNRPDTGRNPAPTLYLTRSHSALF